MGSSENRPSNLVALALHISYSHSLFQGKAKNDSSGTPPTSAVAPAADEKENSVPLSDEAENVELLAVVAKDDADASDKYAAIANLDDEVEIETEEERWIDRTSIITKIDHETNVDNARQIVEELFLGSIQPRTPMKKGTR